MTTQILHEFIAWLETQGLHITDDEYTIALDDENLEQLIEKYMEVQHVPDTN